MTSRHTDPPPRGTAWRGLLLLCLAGVVWGTIGPAVDVVHDRSALSVWAIGSDRAVAAVTALLLSALAAGRLQACRSLVQAHPRRATVVGVLTAAFQLSFFVAVVAAGVSVATVVALGLAPVLLLLVDSRQERRLPVGRALGVAAAVVGLALVCLSGGAQPTPHASLGILAAVGSGAAYALSAHAAAPLSQRYDALTVTTVTMSIAAAVLVPTGMLASYAADRPVVPDDAPSWWLLAHLGVVTMGLAYVLLFAGLRTTPSGAAVVATLLEPVTAVLIAVVLLGESLTPQGVLGSLLIVAAIATLGRRDSTTRDPGSDRDGSPRAESAHSRAG